MCSSRCGILITAAADNAQMHVAVPGMAEADHPHAGGGFQFVDEADEIRRMADGYYNIHRLLFETASTALTNAPRTFQMSAACAGSVSTM